MEAHKRTDGHDEAELDSIQDIASRSLFAAHGDRVVAVKLFQEEVEACGLKPALLERFYGSASRDAIRVAAGSIRAFHWQDTAKVNPDNSSGLASVGRQHVRSILDEWFLSSRVALGDAGKDDIQKEMVMHKTLSQTNGKKAEFYRHVMAAMKDAKRVRDKLSDKDIHKIVARVKLKD